MKKAFFISLLFVCFAALSCSEKKGSETRSGIIPMPVSLTPGEGGFTITKHTAIYCNEAAEKTALHAAAFLRTATGYELPVVIVENPAWRSGGISFYIEPGTDTEDESYTLDITPDNISVVSAGTEGLFYGFQSLRQLLPPEIESLSPVRHTKWRVPAASIEDRPRYEWRGFMLDVSRTFYGVEVVRKYLDVMALYKLNTLHLHLTDDQGWRIEIKKHPRLTAPLSTTFADKYGEPSERSGYYTQEQIGELVRYAAERNITIVPEIDVPGHSWAALLAYTELGVNDKLEPHYLFPFLASWSYWGVQFPPNTLDPTSEDVYRFLDDVFTEVAELFPSEYIHFGGDEAKHHIWEAEPHVREFMKAHGMEGTSDLQAYFASRVCGIIKSKGRKPIGWNDILRDSKNLNRDVAVMSWLGEEAIKEAASHGIYTVAAPATHLYLDVTQADHNDGTTADLGYTPPYPLERVYGYEPTESLLPEEEKYVLGIQGNLWTHIARNVKDMNMQLFPRLLALAEIGWTPAEQRDYAGFLTRLETHYPRLDGMKFDYYRPGGYIAGTWSPDDLTTSFRPVEWDVSRKVYADGRITAGFFYLDGTSYMKIRRVELLQNGKAISADEHQGLADDTRATSLPKTYLYHLEVDNYDPEATYTVRAEVAGETGSDSFGNFTFNLSPYEPFTVTEPAN